jgi:RNA polymerase sigma factor (sigma-70 family)
LEEVLNVEQLLDRYEDFEEKEPKSEDFDDLHFQRIQGIPVLTEPEEQDLLQRWCEFRDEAAKDRIILAHMRMVPAIARAAARKSGLEPNTNMLPGPARKTAWDGYAEVVSDLTAAGNLALVKAVHGYHLGVEAKFYTYARTAVKREIWWEQIPFLRSVVRRKDRSPAVLDLSIDPHKPDPRHVEDNVGRRATPTVRDDPEDDHGDGRVSGFSRLRRHDAEEDKLIEWLDSQPRLHKLPKLQRVIIKGRQRGYTLKVIAKTLNMSTTTVWRKEQAALATLERMLADEGSLDC